jgi:hypothetical protein
VQWRAAEKWQPEPVEAKEDGDGEAKEEVAAPAAAANYPPAALIDDFLDKLREDEYLAQALLTGACSRTHWCRARATAAMLARCALWARPPAACTAACGACTHPS